MFIGKVLGAGVGYILFSLPGAAVGLICGYFYDKRRADRALVSEVAQPKLTARETELVRQAFFNGTFSVMGHLAKADGPVRKAQIKHAETVMERMGLTSQLRSSAIKLFKEGKSPEFDLDRSVKQFRDACENSISLYRVFVEVQIQSALCDGAMVREEEEILRHVSRVLGFTDSQFRQLELLVRVGLGVGDNHGTRSSQTRTSGSANNDNGQRQEQRSSEEPRTSTENQNAFQILGVKKSADAAAVKVAYRKLMNQHHPDKLMSKGLPQEMMSLATDKTQDIQKAYEQIKTMKGW